MARKATVKKAKLGNDHEEMLEWVGCRFDPEAFDPAKATKAMRKCLPDWRKEAW